MGGMTGYLNFAHCTFFGVGAYTFGILFLRKFPLPICFALPVLVVVSYAALISFPLFRIRGVYFALATIGLVRLVEQLAMNLRSLTDGSAGLSIVSGQQLYAAYYMTLILASLALFTNYKILNSKFGLALNCIREDEDVARSFGINSYLYKALALIVSSAFGAFMGNIYMFYITYIIPDTVFGLELVFSPAIMAMLGGTGTLFGPIIGAVFITFLQEVLWAKMTYLHLATYGTIFALVGYFMPGGIMREPKVHAAYRKIVALVRP
jgi:branched-chain amino acid transport system permease protein